MNDPAQMNFDVQTTIFFTQLPLILLFKQKNAKSSPRWQYNSMDIKRCKDLKIATDLIEDERDPDVIPAQYCKFFISSGNISKFHIQLKQRTFYG